MKDSRMKKFALIGLAVLAILVIGVSIAAAQGPAGDDTPVAPGANFVDEDGDGVCDLMGTGAAGNSYRHGAGGANFVDEDNDGVCDLMGTGAAGNSYGRGAGGANFVDEDGDGVCDLMGTGAAGNSYGHMAGGNGPRGGHGGYGAGSSFGQGVGPAATASQ
jgi:hypothetical protein